MPLYPLYALLFRDTGLSVAEISALFALWSVVAILAEVPSGALADRFSRRGALVSAGVVQAAGYLLWVVLPGFGGFAAGFVLWGVAGALASGALEALVYDGLDAVEAADQFARVNGRITAVQLLTQIPVGLVATALFPIGGYVVVGWVSVGCCLAAAALASRLPEAPRSHDEEAARYLATLRAGIVQVVSSRSVAIPIVAVATLGAVEAVEEYFPIVLDELGMPTVIVPIALLAVSLAGAVGSMLAGAAAGLRPITLSVLLAIAAAALAVTGMVHRPVALVGVAVFYGLYRMVLVVVEARLQDRIPSAARATVTSIAGVGIEVVGIGVMGMWAVAGAPVVGASVVLLAVFLAWALWQGAATRTAVPPSR